MVFLFSMSFPGVVFPILRNKATELSNWFELTKIQIHCNCEGVTWILESEILLKDNLEKEKMWHRTSTQTRNDLENKRR